MKFEEATNPLEFNQLVSHPLQSFEWGQFREKTGVKVVRRKNSRDAFQLTIHNAPLGFKIGYFPKGDMPNKSIVEELEKIGSENNCVYIQLEPDVIQSDSNQKEMEEKGLKKSFHPLFTKYTFVLDLQKSEEELLKNMHQKTRYNIKVAQKYGVEVSEDNSNKAFEAYLKLVEETTKRQRFYAHDERYRRLLWETLKTTGNGSKNKLTAHLFTAKLPTNST